MWWLLRRESMVVALALVTLCGLAVSLRLVYTTDYPPGLNEDEPNNLASAVEALQTGHLFRPSRVQFPVLLSSLFEAQLVPVFGANRWTIRTYSLVTSVLSVPAAFAVARALGLSVIPSIAASAFFAVLPWSLFFGRVSEGGELTFHQLLLLAALGRLVLTTLAGWVEVGIGGLGLCLLLYDYWCGRSMLAMPLVAAVLARGRQRLLCLLVLLVAVLGWLPYLLGNTAWERSYYSDHVQAGVAEHSAPALWVKTTDTLRLLISNCGANDWMTISSAGMHPLLILVLALIGVLVPKRRSLFLWAGFVCGLAPAVLSAGAPPHAHRMLMAFPFIALAAGCALGHLKSRVWCLTAAGVVVTVIGLQSVRLYFSPEFWLEDSREIFTPDLTSLVEALPAPPHPRFILDHNIGWWMNGLRGLVDKDYEFLSVQNMYPPDDRPVVYAFHGERRASARAFYENLFGSERVTAFGAAFMVKLEAGDWSWLRQHGWAYQAGCNSQVWRGQIPTLYFADPVFNGLSCSHHVWQGRWRGPHSQLRLDFSGAVVVETSQGRVVEKQGQEQQADFPVEPDTVITVTLTSPPPVYAKLVEITPAGERVPPWERVDPDFDFPAAEG
ncbi:MAG: hypothetical protein ACHQ4J_10930 [Candidatus Binatia bacterium]